MDLLGRLRRDNRMPLAAGGRRPAASTYQTIGDVLHLLMALVMAAMAWPWWYSLPWLAQLIIFAFSTLWFSPSALASGSAEFDPEQLGCHPAWHQRCTP